MKIIAHRGHCQNQNKVSHLLNVLTQDKIDGIELDVRYNTKRQLILCHDRESINSPYNDKLSDLIKVKFPENCEVFLDIKAVGIHDAQHIAKDVVITLLPALRFNKCTFKLCSFNEYCVTELIDLRDESDLHFDIGVITVGIPLGLFSHLAIDFVSADYNTIDEHFVSILHNRNVQVYAFTVNSKSMNRLMRSCNVDGMFVDTPFDD